MKIAFSSVGFQPMRVIFCIHKEINFLSRLDSQITHKAPQDVNGNNLTTLEKVYWAESGLADISLWSTLFITFRNLMLNRKVNMIYRKLPLGQ